MKILLTADPELPVPPQLYGGIERIVHVLVTPRLISYFLGRVYVLKTNLIPCRTRLPYGQLFNNFNPT
jgi:hypothetical protein